MMIVEAVEKAVAADGRSALSGSADGTNSDARFYYADGLALDADENLIVADTGNHLIRYVARTGTNWAVQTIAGSAGVSGDVDGAGPEARFNSPHGVAVASDGSILVTDGSNYKIRNVRRELARVKTVLREKAK